MRYLFAYCTTTKIVSVAQPFEIKLFEEILDNHLKLWPGWSTDLILDPKKCQSFGVFYATSRHDHVGWPDIFNLQTQNRTLKNVHR